MPSMTLTASILPDQLEAWLRFIQEIQGSRRAAYAASRRRLGITKERYWLVERSQTHLALVYIEAQAPDQVLPALAASEAPFDRWYKRQVLDIHSVDLTQAPCELLGELVFEWQDPHVAPHDETRDT